MTDPNISYKQEPPNFLETFAALNGGTVADLASKMMADTAMGTAQHGTKSRKGKLTITLEITAGKGGTNVVNIKHTVAMLHPTAAGKKAEDVGDEQIMFVNRKGALTAAPEEQGSFDFSS